MFNEPFLLQLLVGILLGAKNIEQTKALNFSSLRAMLDDTVKSARLQRDKLRKLAKTELIDKLMAFNIELVKTRTDGDFYYDPHTKHYCGMRKILKGWCAKVRMASKVLNMDFIHNSKGYPVYFNIVDNYDDLRVRFFKEIKKFRQLACFPADKVLTFTVDRGIFSAKVFSMVIHDALTHLITWEKGYKKSRWDDSFPSKQGAIQRKRNRSGDNKKLVKYRYQTMRWDKDPSVAQIIVRIDSPSKGREIEVSILTDDLLRPADIIIFLMFNRWIQENDFKYIIEHFGIDQITSYRYDNYDDIKEAIEDKEAISGMYKSLTKLIDSIRGKLKTVLLKKHKLEKKYGLDTSKWPKEKKEGKKGIPSLINELSEELLKKEQERELISKEVSKIDELIGQGTQKLNTQSKKLMDVVKIIARNIFFLCFEEFRKEYDDFRDDHVIFRNITRAAGIMQDKGGYIRVNLMPEMELTPKTIKTLEVILEQINKEAPKMLDCSGKNILLECKKEKLPLLVF